MSHFSCFMAITITIKIIKAVVQKRKSFGRQQLGKVGIFYLGRFACLFESVEMKVIYMSVASLKWLFYLVKLWISKKIEL